MASYFSWAWNGICNTVVNMVTSHAEPQQAPDPLALIFSSALLAKKGPGARLATVGNEVKINEERSIWLLQSVERWWQGAKHTQLFNLRHGVEWAGIKYQPDEDEEMRTVFERAIQGLQQLEQMYRSLNKNYGKGAANDLKLAIVSAEACLDSTHKERAKIFDDEVKIQNVSKLPCDDYWTDKRIKDAQEHLNIIWTDLDSEDEATRVKAEGSMAQLELMIATANKCQVIWEKDHGDTLQEQEQEQLIEVLDDDFNPIKNQ